MPWAYVLLALLSPSSAAAAEDHRPSLRKAAELLIQSEGNLDKLLFIRRREKREFDSNGAVKSKEIITVRREPFEDLVVMRIIARDDQPLPPEDAKSEDDSIRRGVAALRARIAKEGAPKPGPKKDPDHIALLREFPDAAVFTLTGAETYRGRPGLAYTFAPRPGYSPKSMRSRMFEKMRGKCILDKASGELVYVEAEMFDDVNVAFGLAAKITKGSKFRMSRVEAAPGIWVEEDMHTRFTARLMLFKNLRQEVDTRYTEFRPRPPKTQAHNRVAQ